MNAKLQCIKDEKMFHSIGSTTAAAAPVFSSIILEVSTSI